MAAKELDSIVKKLKEQGKMHFLAPAKEEEITAFEKEHGVLFPKQYREWLLYSDGGECFLPAGVQFYGVSHKPRIDVDEDDQPDKNYIVIGALATGDPIVFRKSEQRISIYNEEAGLIEEDETYVDFFSFLKDLPNILGLAE